MQNATLVNVRQPEEHWVIPGMEASFPHDFALGAAPTQLTGASDRLFALYVAPVCAPPMGCGPLRRFILKPNGIVLPDPKSIPMPTSASGGSSHGSAAAAGGGSGSGSTRTQSTPQQQDSSATMPEPELQTEPTAAEDDMEQFGVVMTDKQVMAEAAARRPAQVGGWLGCTWALHLLSMAWLGLASAAVQLHSEWYDAAWCRQCGIYIVITGDCDVTFFSFFFRARLGKAW